MRGSSSLARRLIVAALVTGAIPAVAAAFAVLLITGRFHGFTVTHPLLAPGLALGLVAVAVGGGLWCIRQVRHVARGLRALNQHAEAMTRGDLTQRVELPGRGVGSGCADELDQLAHALNLLTAQLAQQITERDRYETQLRALNADLERRIEANTHELEEAQRQIVRVEKRVALGQLVAGIAHEINNHVNFITSASEPFEMGVADISQALEAWHRVVDAPLETAQSIIQEALETERRLDLGLVRQELDASQRQIREGAQRIRAIVTNLRTFSHRGEGDSPLNADLGELVEQTLMLVRPRMGVDIRVDLHLEPLGEVPCFPVQLSQVLINLLLNASDALGDRGTVTISTWRERDEIHLSVRDDGPGIPAHLRSKIFDPFVTTKDVGDGTGLGLYVCQQILEDHGGGIHVESIAGEGTEVTLHWPLSQTPVPGAEAVIPANAPPAKNP